MNAPICWTEDIVEVETKRFIMFDLPLLGSEFGVCFMRIFESRRELNTDRRVCFMSKRFLSKIHIYYEGNDGNRVVGGGIRQWRRSQGSETSSHSFKNETEKARM